MKPLFVLLSAFALAVGATRWAGSAADYQLAGNVALAAMLLFTGSAHFFLTRGMARMLPDWLPARTGWVYATGVLELAAAIGLLLPALRPLTGWALLLFFLLVLPANVYAAVHHIDYQRGTTDGPGPRALWVRVPLQLVFMAWTWYFAC